MKLNRFLPLLLLLILSAVMTYGQTVERLDNGLRLITASTTASQMVSITVLIDYSALDEQPSLQGLRAVLLDSMMQGTELENGTALRRTLTAAGGILQSQVHQDMLEITISIPADGFPTALNVISEFVTHPLLSRSAVDATVQQQLTISQQEPQGALPISDDIAHSSLFAHHPYSGSIHGKPETLIKINAATVLWAYQHYVTPARTIISVAGRCNPEDVKILMQGSLGNWLAPTVALPPARFTDEPIELTTTKTIIKEREVKNTCVMLAFPVCGAANPDSIPLRVLESLLSGGTGSRLFRNVREEKRLAYDVATNYPVQANSSEFSVFALTDAVAMEAAKSALVAELAKVQTEKVTNEELQRAKAYLKTHYLLSHQYSSQYSFDLAWQELIGVGVKADMLLPTKIDAVTADDLQRVARAYFTHYYLIVTMPQVLPAPGIK
ncbi:MAG: pitrilysin family protein [bacterium]